MAGGIAAKSLPIKRQGRISSVRCTGAREILTAEIALRHCAEPTKARPIDCQASFPFFNSRACKILPLRLCC
jgi:hypothetical protein